MSSSSRRTRRRRTSGLLSALLVAAVILGCYSGYALLRPLPAVAVSENAALPALDQAAAPLAWPAHGVAAIGAVGTDGLLELHGSGARTPIASMTKTITALVVLDKMPLHAGENGPDYVFTENDLRILNDTVLEGGSRAPVIPGVTVTERQLLEGLMLPSGNNYAVTLANLAYGSMDNFLLAARSWLDRQGLTDTVLADASGINPGSQSSPANLVEIGKLVLAHPVLSEIVGQKTVQIPGLGELKNTNGLLGTEGIIGIKTGTTIIAGACLLFAAEQKIGSETVTVVGVVIGAVDHAELFDAVPTLLRSVRAAYHDVGLTAAGDPVGYATTEWGARANIVAARSARAVVWQDAPISRKLAFDSVTPGDSGTPAGSMIFAENGRETVIPLELAAPLDAASPWWRLTHPW